MKKIFFLFFLLLFNFAFALEEMQDVGIAKYAVLEVLRDNTPLRETTNENAKRLVHLYKNTILFADKETQNYYRVELKENKYAWVNKKNIEVQAIIPEKRISNINSITFKNRKKSYDIKIQSEMNTAFEIKEDKTNLEFVLFDNRFDSIETKVKGKNTHFSYEDKIQNDFKLNYKNDTNLFGYSLDKIEDNYLLTIKKAPKIDKKRPFII